MTFGIKSTRAIAHTHGDAVEPSSTVVVGRRTSGGPDLPVYDGINDSENSAAELQYDLADAARYVNILTQSLRRKRYLAHHG